MERYQHNPILTRTDIPEIPPHLVDVSSVFNPGAVRFGDQFLLMLRVQNRGRETFLLTATSNDGVHFSISDQIVHFRGIEQIQEKIYHCYDPRITRIDDVYYIMFAMDMDDGCRLGLAQTMDFEQYDFLGIVSDDDNRNGVLFPEKINGKYLRLDRPNKVQLAGGPTSGSAICLSESNDLLHWRTVGIVATGRFHYWDELIGAGPPPIKTEQGWLQIYHGVATHFGSANIYQAGVMLLDLKDPLKVIARSRYNILEPREMYELVGQVPNVVFPSGAIVEKADANGFAELDSRVFIYYGAADTCVGLAVSTVAELIELAKIS
ncbi:MAG: glycoside hydrolase family 130 protein [candidate division KSB1 bacterium]|nr:glycoside hydrolase family 130 protein [candidate division KSB1 bacterium]